MTKYEYMANFAAKKAHFETVALAVGVVCMFTFQIGLGHMVQVQGIGIECKIGRVLDWNGMSTEKGSFLCYETNQ